MQKLAKNIAFLAFIFCLSTTAIAQEKVNYFNNNAAIGNTSVPAGYPLKLKSINDGVGFMIIDSLQLYKHFWGIDDRKHTVFQLAGRKNPPRFESVEDALAKGELAMLVVVLDSRKGEDTATIDETVFDPTTKTMKVTVNVQFKKQDEEKFVILDTSIEPRTIYIFYMNGDKKMSLPDGSEVQVKASNVAVWDVKMKTNDPKTAILQNNVRRTSEPTAELTADNHDEQQNCSIFQHFAPLKAVQ